MGRRNGTARRPLQRYELRLQSANTRLACNGSAFRLLNDPVIANRGELSFMVFEGTCGNAIFIESTRRLLGQAKRKIYLIVNGHPVHRSAAIRRFVDARRPLAADSTASLLSRVQSRRVARPGDKNQCPWQKPANQHSANDVVICIVARRSRV
jgi:hypothetical protein